MAHIIFKDLLVVFEIGAAAPKNNEKNVETSPWVCPWLSPLVVNLQSKIKGWRLRKWMNATPGNNKSSRKTKKGRIPTTKLREQQPCQPLKYPSTSPRKERIPLTSFHPGLRDPSPQKPATPPSRKASERRWHPNKRDLSQGWQRTTTFQDQATFLPQKEEEPASSKHFLFI